jgi:hypothetical protein
MYKTSTIEYPDFESINVTTTTVTVQTNLKVNLEWLYSILDIVSIEPIHKPIKTSKQLNQHVINLNPKYGSIITAQHKDKKKGFKISKKKVQTQFFRNNLSIAIFVEKLITIKIPKRGQLQITGAISQNHIELCIKYLWELINSYESGPHSYTLLNSKSFETTCNTVMTNIKFNIGFKIDRQNLDMYINRYTMFHSLLETSCGYTGVNIKGFYDLEPEKTPIITYKCNEFGIWETGTISYIMYVNTFSEAQRKKKLSKRYKNSFLVFQSGAIIMSGKNLLYMKGYYEEFINILKMSKTEIEEILITDEYNCVSYN